MADRGSQEEAATNDDEANLTATDGAGEENATSEEAIVGGFGDGDDGRVRQWRQRRSWGLGNLKTAKDEEQLQI